MRGFEPYDKNPKLLTDMLTPKCRVVDQIYKNILKVISHIKNFLFISSFFLLETETEEASLIRRYPPSVL